MKKSLSWSLVGVIILVGVVYVLVVFKMIEKPASAIPKNSGSVNFAREVQSFKELFSLLEKGSFPLVKRPDTQSWQRLFSVYTNHKGVPYILEAQAIPQEGVAADQTPLPHIYVLYNGAAEASMKWYGPFKFKPSIIDEVRKLKKGQKIGEESIVQSIDVNSLTK
jgi:hypothetical protein